MTSRKSFFPDSRTNSLKKEIWLSLSYHMLNITSQKVPQPFQRSIWGASIRWSWNISQNWFLTLVNLIFSLLEADKQLDFQGLSRRRQEYDGILNLLLFPGLLEASASIASLLPSLLKYPQCAVKGLLMISFLNQ